tara:strand:- start:923 stop:1699 length:777 start_codon:yes stop_codon:yes gene_type:complete
MKKLLLLSALLIFACSSGDGNNNDDNNNNSSNKKISSITVEGNYIEADNSYLFYTNDELTLVESDYFYHNGDINIGQDGIDRSTVIEYLDDVVRITKTGENPYVQDLPVDNNGAFSSSSFIFEDNYLVSMSGLSSGTGEAYYNWENGNLISVQGTNGVGDTNFSFTYSNYDNLAGLGWDKFSYHFSTDLIFFMIGLYGNVSSKLPSESIEITTEETTTRIYSYLFDDEGYPNRIIVNEETTYNGGSNRTITYNFTYTN